MRKLTSFPTFLIITSSMALNKAAIITKMKKKELFEFPLETPPALKIKSGFTIRIAPAKQASKQHTSKTAIFSFKNKKENKITNAG